MNKKLLLIVLISCFLITVIILIIKQTTNNESVTVFYPTPIDTALVRINKKNIDVISRGDLISWKRIDNRINKISKQSNAKKETMIIDVISRDELLNSHIDNRINCKFKDAIKIPQIANYFTNEDEDNSKWRFTIFAQNQKVVFQNVKGYLYVFNVNENTFLYSNSCQAVFCYYTNPQYRSPYFLVKYKQREIPTLFPEQTLKLLPKWEQTWIKENNVSQEYFDEHIRVINVSFNFWEKGKINDNFTASINYLYTVGWANKQIKDYFVLEEKEHPFIGTKRKSITKIFPYSKVVSIEELVNTVSTISDTVYMNLNHLIIDRVDRNKLKAYFRCNIDFKNNRQWLGKIDLESGNMDLNKNSGIWIN